MLMMSSSGQLIGNRGVVTLPEGFVYHDNLTLAASRLAARSLEQFLKIFQININFIRFAFLQEHGENEKRIIKLQKNFGKVDLTKAIEPEYRKSPNKVCESYLFNLSLSQNHDNNFSTFIFI